MVDFNSGIKIIEVRIRNFRSLKEININLDWLTVLIGENNSGKTSFLDALFVAIGAGKRIISSEDIFLTKDEKSVPKNREILIDILIKPTDDNGVIIDKFPAGSYWLGLFGDGISQDNVGNDYLGIRTKISYNSQKGEYEIERKFISEWQNDITNFKNTKTTSRVPYQSIEPLALHFMDAKRDIRDELRNRGSFWHKLVSNPGISEENIKKFEEKLDLINSEILTQSSNLKHIQKHLNEIYKSVGGEKNAVAINPIPRYLRNINEGVSINFSTKNAQTFPLDRHGMGTRSLAAILTFRAYTEWRKNIAVDEKVHIMLAIEEPEAHLHPQAQRALFKQIENISGQRIISTHSAYIASQADITQFRCFRKEGAFTEVTQIEKDKIETDDIQKINRSVMNTRGELIFSRALIFFEGIQTEDQAIPIFAEKYWNIHPNALGITMIPACGTGYYPFILIAKEFHIPWYIFSDGEPQIVASVKSALEKAGEPLDSDRVFTIPDNKKFEEYIVNDDYQNVLIEMIIDFQATNNKHRTVLEKSWKEKNNPKEEIINYLTRNKTKCGRKIAEVITSLDNDNLKFPDLIRSMFERISKDLCLEKYKEGK